MFKPEIVIQSHKGPYKVHFFKTIAESLKFVSQREKCNYIVDRHVFEIYKNFFTECFDVGKFIYLDACEKNKSFEALQGPIEALLSQNIRRDHTLIGIGGGITQDVTCFIASSLFRGISWEFIPTTLLAQADSCIGSKNSINFKSWKNIIGGFYPPNQICISVDFLKSLDQKDILSGLGEMIKVHIIDGVESFHRINSDYEELFLKSEQMNNYIYSSLMLKKRLIEEDEFDKGARVVMNYGHSFGHAIESATEFKIPHGVAVTIGMDMANFVAKELKLLNLATQEECSILLRKNAKNYMGYDIPQEAFFNALRKDKKNIGDKLRLILLTDKSGMTKQDVLYDAHFREICSRYFKSLNQ